MDRKSSRSINCNFPVRALIVDASSPSSHDMVENVSEALSNFFALISEIIGHCRVPYFSLFVTGQRCECVYPLQQVKGNFPKLHMSIQELRMQDGYGLNHHSNTGVLKKTISEALSQFKRWSLTKKTESRSTVYQMELCVITSQKQEVMEENIADIFHELDLEVLKKIQIINIDQAESGLDEKMKLLNSGSERSCNEALQEYMEFTTIENDIAALEQMFKGWMLDIGTDDVHLTIDLPTPHGEEIQLKCDLEDRFLNPMYLPHCQQMFVQTGLQSCPPGSYSQPRGNLTSSIPIVHLTAQKIIKTSGVCESLLFGQPLIVKPTSCWKLEWEDLDSNQQQFQVIRSYLIDKEYTLLLASRAMNSQAPIGYFVLLPSEGSSMLLKAVASRDLLLPMVKSLSMEKHSGIVQSRVEASINMLPRSNLLNPVELNAGIAKKILNAKTKVNSRNVPKKRGSKDSSSTVACFQEANHWQKSKQFKPSF